MPIIISALLLFMAACTPAAPISVNDAFHALAAVYETGDAERFSSLLSEKSLADVDDAVRTINNLNRHQKAYLHELGLRFAKNGETTVEDYLLMLVKREHQGTVALAFQSGISSVAVIENRATVYAASGLELLFVREGPYWKFVLP